MLVQLIAMKKGYMQPIAEIEAAFADLKKVQNLLLQMHLLQMRVQSQLQMPMPVQLKIAVDKIDSVKRWS